MEHYNNYYTTQPGHPPPSVSNQQHSGGSHMQQPPQGGQMMHSQMPSQNIRQAVPPGPPSHHQQVQQIPQQQHMGHHLQQMPPQQQHPNYHPSQQPHTHGPPGSHSNSPHAQQQQSQSQQPQPPPQQQQQQQQHHNHQPSMTGPLPSQSGMSSHVHAQSPHHHGGPQMHVQGQQQQSINQMVRPHMGGQVMNHQQSGLQQPVHHQQNFFNSGPAPPPPQSNLYHHPQQSQIHNHHQPQHYHQHHQSPMMQHAPPIGPHHPHIQHAIGRNSPYYPSILQTEMRIIELNRRLQSRPISRHPANPLPSPTYDESIWWEKFASEFFEDDATLTLRTQEDKSVDYTIGRTLIPRFFRTYFDGGVTDLSINLRNPKEACIHPHMLTLDCDQAFIVTSNIFRHPAIATNQGLVVHTEGHLVLDFVSNSFDTLSIKSWRFDTKCSREYIDRSIVNIDRSTMGLPHSYLAESVTRHGLTKSTISYLKMCMIMEPMQDLMFQHRQSKIDPRLCLRKLLFDRYKFRSGEDNRVATSKRRKRKPSAAPAISAAAANKKSKANVNNTIGSNSGLNNNVMMSPSGAQPSFSLASQDVMVVGEPSMMGGDFGDDNERLITRLENTQYDPAASTPTNLDESDNVHTSTGNDNGISTSNNIESNIENHMSPSSIQHRHQLHQISQQQPIPQSLQQQQHQQLQQQPQQQPNQQLQPQLQHQEKQQQPLQQAQQQPQQQPQQPQQQQQQEDIHHQVIDESPTQIEVSPQIDESLQTVEPLESTQEDRKIDQEDFVTNEEGLVKIENEEQQSQDDQATQADPESIEKEEPPKIQSDVIEENGAPPISEPNPIIEEQPPLGEGKPTPVVERPPTGDSISMGVNSVENEESNSNSQLSCSNPTTTSTIEQQALDNGVA